MARTRNTPCSICGKLLYVGSGSSSRPICHPCRRVRKGLAPSQRITIAGRPCQARSISCETIFPHHHVWIEPCPDCGKWVTKRNPNVIKRCPSCSVSALRALNARKNQKRRAQGQLTISVEDLAVRDGARCHLCHRKVDLRLPGNHAWGPTIDHLVPGSKGGTNDPANLALAHWRCNVQRGNRGVVQLLLTA